MTNGIKCEINVSQLNFQDNFKKYSIFKTTVNQRYRYVVKILTLRNKKVQICVLYVFLIFFCENYFLVCQDLDKIYCKCKLKPYVRNEVISYKWERENFPKLPLRIGFVMK